MLYYYLTYLLILVIPLFVNKCTFDEKRRIKQKAFLIALALIVLMAFRHPSMGSDLLYGSSNSGYLHSYEDISTKTWQEIFRFKSYLNYEQGYIVFNRLISVLSNNPQFLITMCAIISILPVYSLIKNYSMDPCFSFIVYLAIPSFLILFSGLRQGIAIGICCLGYPFIEKRKIVKFIILVLFASLFHTSAFVFLICFPVFRIHVSKKTRLFSLIIPLLCYCFRTSLFTFFTSHLNIMVNLDNNGAINLFLVFMVVYATCIFFIKDNDIVSNSFLNIFFLSICVQAFGGIFIIAIRVGYYYMIPLVIALPNIMERISVRNTKLIMKTIVGIIFIAYGLYSLYASGSSWPMSYPYHFMWESL